jgi:2-dehydropantoate 2-reductase
MRRLNVRHAIVGAGGVGGTIGAVLAKAGENVVLVVRPGTANLFPRELTLQSTFGTISAPVDVAESLADGADVVWITVKATQLKEALAGIASNGNIKGVVPLLNGIDHVRLLRQKFKENRVFPATIAGEMERVALGKVVHPSPFLRLNVASSGRTVLQKSIDELSRFGLDCKFIDNETTLLWSKLVVLAPFALSTTAADQPIGGVLSDPGRRKLMESCAREACAAGVAERAEVDPNATIKILGSSPAAMRSSMQKDVAAGRTPELDAVAGPILHSAEAHAVAAPATEQLVEEIRRRVSGILVNSDRVPSGR